MSMLSGPHTSGSLECGGQDGYLGSTCKSRKRQKRDWAEGEAELWQGLNKTLSHLAKNWSCGRQKWSAIVLPPIWFSHLTQVPWERARLPTEEAILPLKQTLKKLPAEGCGLTAFPVARRQAPEGEVGGASLCLPGYPTSPQSVNKDWFYFNFFQQRKGITFSYIQCWIWNYHYNFYSIDCQVVNIIFLDRLKLPAHSSIYLRNIF